MGANVSNQLNESTSKIVNDVLTDISVKIDNKLISVQKSKQVMSIIIEGSTISSNLIASQKSTMAVTAILQADNNLKNDIANEITNKLKESMENTLKQENTGLNLGQFNVGNAVNKTNTYIENNIKNLLSTGISNSVENVGESEMAFKFNLKNSNVKGDVNISQEAQITAISQNIAKTIVENSIKNALTTDIVKDMKNTADQKNTGIDMFALLGIAIVVIGGGLILRFSMSGKAIGAEYKNFKKAIEEQSDNENSEDEDYYGGIQSPSPDRNRTHERSPRPDRHQRSELDYSNSNSNNRHNYNKYNKSSNSKTKIIIGCIILLVLIFIVWYYMKKKVANDFDTSYLSADPLIGTPSGFMSGFINPGNSSCYD